jgi:hypothetical protein
MTDNCEKATGMAESRVAEVLASLRPADPINDESADDSHWTQWGTWCDVRDSLSKLADDPSAFIAASMA